MDKNIFLWLVIIGIIIGMGFSVFGETKAESKETVYIIPINGEITPAMATFFVKSLQEAENLGADAILVELSTFGGRVDAALNMKQAIEQSKIPIVVYISDRGYISRCSYCYYCSQDNNGTRQSYGFCGAYSL